MTLASSQMASSSLGEIEELTLCSCCKRAFDDVERPPKLLSCKHHFCLACARGVLGAGREVYCMHCWKRTELPDGRADTLPTHGAVLALARRLAAPAPPPAPPPAPRTSSAPRTRCPRCEARALLARDTRDLLLDLARLAARQRDLLLRALDAATALKLRLEAELAAPAIAPAALALNSLPAAAAERERLRAQHAEALVQCRLDDLVRTATVPLDFELLRRALGGLGPLEIPLTTGAMSERRDPLLLLSNYCTAAVFARAWGGAGERGRAPAGGEADAACGAALREAEVAADSGASPAASASSASAVASPLIRNPGMFPLFYFELEVNGAPFGRIVIEVRDDVAPRMARNFSMLASGELGVGYRGCAVFQCWENESVITGDFELNNGRGGRSVFEESYFMPDDTRMAAVRGSVGMRRSQKRHDNLGLVGSQFRIVLREMRGFTAIFAFVVEGLELVDRLSRTGDSAGKPHTAILIASCGKLS
ncbi:unnamed protein product [Chrysodeixis includens]|uniref:Peptidyl-prolyl cis-trans isomerase n=1 Tax=Chrysodeixis includens TaxID=689277 RepID=A0A9N8KSD7_CHRIL|nr:unnamed protein product [Chrysodeixis includens]